LISQGLAGKPSSEDAAHLLNSGMPAVPAPPDDFCCFPHQAVLRSSASGRDFYKPLIALYFASVCAQTMRQAARSPLRSSSIRLLQFLSKKLSQWLITHSIFPVFKRIQPCARSSSEFGLPLAFNQSGEWRKGKRKGPRGGSL